MQNRSDSIGYGMSPNPHSTFSLSLSHIKDEAQKRWHCAKEVKGDRKLLSEAASGDERQR